MVPVFIVEALSQKLNRPVSLAEAGFDEKPENDHISRSLLHQEDIAATLELAERLGQADVERREFIYLLPFSVGAAVTPQRNWLLHLLEFEGGTSAERLTSRQVDGMRSMLKLFLDADNEFGGQHARSALSSYLRNDVVPMLYAVSGNDVTRSDMFSAAAELYMTLGWMTYDMGADGLAQRYLTQGLRLAQEGGSEGLSIGSHILSAMSHISTSSGEPKEGVAFAHAAVHTAEKTGSPATLTRAHAMKARAYASLRDRGAAFASMRKAESTFADGARDPKWMNFIDHPYLMNQLAYCFREVGDMRNLSTYARDSMVGSLGRQLTAAEVYLACSLLTQGELEEAIELGTKAAHRASSMRSQIAGRLVVDLRDRVQGGKSANSPGVDRFIDVASSLAS
ncbi:hypothetical protein OOK29_46200 [Streptomyces phaeochromogenes]|uniref:hypothetical protein n=1 Tax=Streptomyces phaeochromogenes TaxID=1923 RepID=UPI00225A3867|nr:hypothetical protein [Streptomyces phaeochromogenes]MCX5605537.1 hypothetical protein [Streptomyces phaeochromogenes]WSJ06422.1 hypothetical protein OG437_23610 [Streptomyces phaeochromogenes]